MRNKRGLFFILILFLILFSTSFVCASEATQDTDDIIQISVPDTNGVGENSYVDDVSLGSDQSSESVLGLSYSSQNTNESENDNNCLTLSNEESELLQERPRPPFATVNLYGGTIEDITNAIRENPGPNTIICLNGGNYTGVGEDQKGGSNLNGVSLQRVWIYGGSVENPDLIANIDVNGWAIWMGDTKVDDVRFSNINVSCNFLYFVGDNGYANDLIIENCQSLQQFVAFQGSSNRVYPVKRATFEGCNQTYDDFPDGHGQFVAAISASFDECNFINTRSGHHGGAICIADESDWAHAYRASSITNTNFINVTSAWFAVYIHGQFKDSNGTIEKPILIENCNFINCTASDEFGACLGISHDNTTIVNCKFINNTAGQGTAIMVGGISKSKVTVDDRAFNGDNTKGNNISIINCTFENNVATQHECRWVLPDGSHSVSTGDGGAIYIVGNDTKVINCTFDKNYAESGNGSAVYIVGLRTNIENCTFTNHESFDGTVFIEGNNNLIHNSTFTDNIASNGAGVYIKGNDTEISNSTFERNTVSNQGGAIYVEGNHLSVDSTDFLSNEAIPGADLSSGLGGAIYVKGNDSNTNGNNFLHNVARNGSAIYTDGNNFTLQMIYLKKIRHGVIFYS